MRTNNVSVDNHSNRIEAERMASEAKRRGISIFAIGVTMQVIEVSYIIIPYLNVDI
jgi:hypothetical protein